MVVVEIMLHRDTIHELILQHQGSPLRGDIENLNGWIFHAGYARIYRLYPVQISYALGPGDQRYVGLSANDTRRAHIVLRDCNC